MRILVTNDDGVDSPGIHALAAALVADGHDVFVVAPTDDRSGAGASIGRLIGGGPPPVKFQHRQGPPVRAGVGCGLELLMETTALPVREFQPAHLGHLLIRW